MNRSLHVRLDDSSEAALGVVRSDGLLTDSEAVRVALREAANARRARAALAGEVAALIADESDRVEMRAVQEQLAELAPAPGD